MSPKRSSLLPEIKTPQKSPMMGRKGSDVIEELDNYYFSDRKKSQPEISVLGNNIPGSKHIRMKSVLHSVKKYP